MSFVGGNVVTGECEIEIDGEVSRVPIRLCELHFLGLTQKPYMLIALYEDSDIFPIVLIEADKTNSLAYSTEEESGYRNAIIGGVPDSIAGFGTNSDYSYIRQYVLNASVKNRVTTYIAIMDNPFPWRIVTLDGPMNDTVKQCLIGETVSIWVDIGGPHDLSNCDITIKDDSGNPFTDYTIEDGITDMDIKFTMPSTDLYIKVEYDGAV